MKLLIYPDRIPKRGILFVLIMVLFTCSLVAQEPTRRDTFDITRHSLRFPHSLPKWGFKIGTGLIMAKPPMDLLENAIQAPLVNAHMTFGLPWKFVTLEGDATSVVVSNQFALGPHFVFGYRNFAISAGWDIAWMYGQLRQFGFDNSTHGWTHYPNISLGYKLKSMAFTLKGEAVYIASLTQKSGENELSRTTNHYNGCTFALYLEQRLWKDHVFIVGFKDNYVKYYWPTWMIFTTFNRYYHIPELSFTWIL